jgi:trimeric autotransporter adhesin
MKTIVPIFRVLLTTLCIASFRETQAVTPPPDGGYPNFTTAEGTNALKNLTGGAANTAVGWYSLFTNNSGSYNTALGAATLLFNTADSNTAIGTAALLFNTGGANNTAVGTGALVNNLIGVDNTAIGYQALSNNNEGGVNNTGSWNTATGSQALYSNTDGRFNCGFGVQALFSNTIGEDNNAFGYQALFNSVNGFANSAFGTHALLDNVDGQQNSAFGSSALVNNVHGDQNTAIGVAAGGTIDGNGNVCIGAFVQGESGVDNSTYIRNVNTLAQPIVAGIDGVTVRLVDGRLGHGVSSRRYKQDIKPMEEASEALYALKPVTFHYNKEIDPTQTLDFGLIAEEVAEVNPELAVRDGEGKISNYRRDAISAMLLNEFLKAHRKMEQQASQIEQQATTISHLKSEIETIIAHSKEQDLRIQKVSDQVQINRSGARVAVTDQ